MNFSAWELHLDFEIARMSPDMGYADGFGLFYARDRKLGTTFGTVPGFVGFGIVLDTHRNGPRGNTPFPVLQVHVLNGSVPHSWSEDGLPTALVNVHAPVMEKPYSELTVRC